MVEKNVHICFHLNALLLIRLISVTKYLHTAGHDPRFLLSCTQTLHHGKTTGIMQTFHGHLFYIQTSHAGGRVSLQTEDVSLIVCMSLGQYENSTVAIGKFGN